MSHFICCILDYSSAVNNDTTYGEALYKYLFKVFYKITNKKEYNSQIWKYIMYYTNILIIKDVIISENTKKKKVLKYIIDTTSLAEVA